jgi:hypothetical protein
MKVRVYFFEAIQGGGGAVERRCGAAYNSEWLIRAYVRAYENRYGDTLIARVV